jgi:hypothetical protein
MDLQPALLVCAAATLLGTILSMRMPQWIERAGVAMAFSYHGSAKQATSHLRTSLWGNLVIKVSVGFLFVYPAFVVQAQPEAGSRELVALSIIGVAATVGTLVGSTATDRMAFAHPPKVVMCCAIAVTTATAVAVAVGNLYAIAVAALAVSLCSAFGKAALDSVIQGESPEESLVSSFGRYEALLQIGWVAGGVVAMLSPAIPCWGLLVVSSILVSGLAVTILSYSDRTRVWGRKLCRLLPVGNGSGA